MNMKECIYEHFINIQLELFGFKGDLGLVSTPILIFNTWRKQFDLILSSPPKHKCFPISGTLGSSKFNVASLTPVIS